MRVVFDTNTVISALLFGGTMDWLVTHWQSGLVVPLVSQATTEELLRVLHYSKFGLSDDKANSLTNRYLPFTKQIEVFVSSKLPQCRDIHDQKFIDLAVVGKAEVLVSGDNDLQVMKALLPFAVLTPKEYRRGFNSSFSSV